MVPTKKCTYVLCFSCYSTKANGKRLSRRVNIRKEKSDICDHDVTQLELFNDDEYFKHEYRSKCDYAENLATVCAQCGSDKMRG